jgi:hypothetical protein
MTNQPSWKVIANLGDATPLEYGGAFLKVDETGVYCPELIVWDEPTVGNHPISWGGLESDPEASALEMAYEQSLKTDDNECGETIYIKRLPDGLARVIDDCEGWEELCEREGIEWEWQYEVYRFPVERLYKVEHEDHIYYVTKHIRESFEDGTLPYPISTYREWFLASLDSIDEPGVVLGRLLSEDPIENAMAYLSIANYYGYENFDSYPLHMGKRELIEWARRHLPGADLNPGLRQNGEQHPEGAPTKRSTRYLARSFGREERDRDNHHKLAPEQARGGGDL